MNPQIAQAKQPQVNPNQAGANLGFINTLQEHLLQYKAQQGQNQAPNPIPAQATSQGTPTNQNNPTDVKAEIQGLEGRLMDELATVKAELQSQKDGKKEFDDLKKQIEGVLNSTE